MTDVKANRGRNWPDSRLDELRVLAKEGLSGSEIGERFGMSRSAVIAMASRMGISLGGWSPDRTNKLRTLWTVDGKSASEIAVILGNTTRAAVIAKLDRLGLVGNAEGRETRAQASKPRRVASITPPRARKPTPPAPPRLSIAGTGTVFETAPDTPDPILKSRAWEPLPGSTPVPLMDVGACMCRWPIGDPQSPDFGFCGRKTAKTYCESHAAIAFTPGATKRRVDDRLGITQPNRRAA